jgi:CRP-like cAMP-binding protein
MWGSIMPKYAQDARIPKLFHNGQPLSYSKGEVILGNLSKPDGVYFIDSGYVKIYTISDEGEEYLSIIYGSGEVFPILWAYLDIEPEILFYETLSDCILWRISREWFNKAITLDVATGYAFAIQLAQQFSIFIDRVDNLEYKKASERVAYRLLFLASRFGIRDSEDQISIDAPITHQIFANSINLSRESVSREIEKLTQQDIIQSVNSHLIVKSIPALFHQLSQPSNFKNWYL